MVQEPTTRALQALYRADSSMLVWWGTETEVRSAIARLERSEQLSASGVEEALQRLAALHEHWRELRPTLEIRDIASQLLHLHPLRAADSLQLASALRAQRVAEIDLAFVCLDQRLSDAARAEGMSVIDESALLQASPGALGESSTQEPASSRGGS